LIEPVDSAEARQSSPPGQAQPRGIDPVARDVLVTIRLSELLAQNVFKRKRIFL
jgi:hypothetical protein